METGNIVLMKNDLIDVAKAFKVLHEDKRWFGTPAAMSSYVYPGCGYGGYCLPKDTSALARISEEYGFEPKIGAALAINLQACGLNRCRKKNSFLPAKVARILVRGSSPRNASVSSLFKYLKRGSSFPFTINTGDMALQHE